MAIIPKVFKSICNKWDTNGLKEINNVLNKKIKLVASKIPDLTVVNELSILSRNFRNYLINKLDQKEKLNDVITIFLRSRLYNTFYTKKDLFEISCIENCPAIVKKLIQDPEIDINNNKLSYFEEAAENGHIEILKILLNDPRIIIKKENCPYNFNRSLNRKKIAAIMTLLIYNNKTEKFRSEWANNFLNSIIDYNCNELLITLLNDENIKLKNSKLVSLTLFRAQEDKKSFNNYVDVTQTLLTHSKIKHRKKDYLKYFYFFLECKNVHFVGLLLSMPCAKTIKKVYTTSRKGLYLRFLVGSIVDQNFALLDYLLSFSNHFLISEEQFKYLINSTKKNFSDDFLNFLLNDNRIPENLKLYIKSKFPTKKE